MSARGSRLGRTPARALAAALGLAIALVPASSGLAAKTPAKHGTVKGCSLKKKAKCKKARITKAKVGKVNLSGTDLSGATITGATFTGTDLTGVNLTGATITNTTFSNVKVGNLVLNGARLTDVDFKGATEGVARQSAREDDCTGTEITVFGQDPGLQYTCTGGGVQMHGAVLSHHVEFANSVIPHSDFAGISIGSPARGHGILGFSLLILYATDAHASDFTWTTAPVGVFGDSATRVASNVSRSPFDQAWVWAMNDVNANQASFLGTSWVNDGHPAFAEHDVSADGARGLRGGRQVTLNVQPRLATVGALNIHEDGFWKVGRGCPEAGVTTCTFTAAVGEPLTVQAWATSDIQIAGPADWTCTRQKVASDHPYLAVCTVPDSATGPQTAEVQPYVAPTPPVTTHVVQVTVTPPGWQASHLQVDVVNASGVVLSSTVCDNTDACSATVTDGSRVRVSARSDTDWLFVTCAPGDVQSDPVPPGTPFACPDAAITADRTTTVFVSP